MSPAVNKFSYTPASSQSPGHDAFGQHIRTVLHEKQKNRIIFYHKNILIPYLWVYINKKNLKNWVKGTFINEKIKYVLYLSAFKQENKLYAQA